MQTQELIDKLALDLTPKPHKGVGGSIALYLAVTTVTMIAGTFLMGPRADLMQKTESVRFLSETAGIFLTFLVAGLGALLLSVPGQLRTEKYLLLLSLSLALWLGTLCAFGISETLHANPLTMDWGYACTVAILCLAITPSALLFFLVRRQAPTRLGWNAFAVATSAFSAGALALQIHCPIDAVLHHLVWHGLPVFVFGALSASVGAKILQW